MKSRLLKEGELRTFAVVFETDEEATQGLLEFARKENLGGCHFTAIGAFRNATLGYFDLEQKDYVRHRLDEQVEVVSLIGNIFQHQGKPKLHAHAVIGRRDATALGGHLMEAHVRATLEVVLIEEPKHLRRRLDQQTGLPLIEL